MLNKNATLRNVVLTAAVAGAVTALATVGLVWAVLTTMEELE
jgi:hypothetical protein